MKPEQVEKRDGKARIAQNVVQRCSCLSDQYEMTVLDPSNISPTGLLLIAKLTPKNPQRRELPIFLFRWDENTDALDIDVENASNTERNLFRNGTTQYSGHQTTRIIGRGRLCEAEIRWSGNIIYRGRIQFGVVRSFSVTMKGRGRMKARAEVVKKAKAE